MLKSFLLLLLATPAFAGPFYGVTANVDIGTATMNISGLVQVAASSVTATTPTITLDGTTGDITMTGLINGVDPAGIGVGMILVTSGSHTGPVSSFTITGLDLNAHKGYEIVIISSHSGTVLDGPKLDFLPNGEIDSCTSFAVRIQVTSGGNLLNSRCSIGHNIDSTFKQPLEHHCKIERDLVTNRFLSTCSGWGGDFSIPGTYWTNTRAFGNADLTGGNLTSLVVIENEVTHSIDQHVFWVWRRQR